MSYTAISSSFIGAAKANFRSLWELIQGNFASHQSRLNAIEATFLLVPVGTIIHYPSASVPSGYLACDGAAVSRTTYADLFAEIGTTYGAGNTTTTFNVPDTRGRLIVNNGQGIYSGATSRTAGASGGFETHTLLTAELPSHTHTTHDPSHSHGWGDAKWNTGAGLTAFQDAPSAGSPYSPDHHLTSESTGISINNNVGAGGAHANVQPSLVLNTIIKT